MVGLFVPPRDIRKRQEPHISVMEQLMQEAEIREIIDEEEKLVKEETFQKAMSDYAVAKLDLRRAKRRYGALIASIRTSIGLPEFLDS